MRDENVAGVILSPTLPRLAHYRQSDFSFPVVLVDRCESDTDADAVVLDNVDLIISPLPCDGIFGHEETIGSRCEVHLSSRVSWFGQWCRQADTPWCCLRELEHTVHSPTKPQTTCGASDPSCCTSH